jgi:hypothetical protein
MKIQKFQKFLAVTAVASLGLLASNVLAQSSSTSTTAATTPQLSYGVSQVVQLAHANVGEDVIVNYVQNSGNAYGLDANQILYLKQQGVSDRVINTMLNQPKPAVAATTVAMPTTPAPQPMPSSANTSTAETSTATVAPAVTYVQTAPPTCYYCQPYYYPAYAWYPPVTFSFGWGGWYGGGWHSGWHGGWHGGWHR